MLIQPTGAQNTTVIQRDKILWASGYWGPPGINNPANTLGASWESKFMYDVLFDWNPVLKDNELVGFLGKTMSWSDTGNLLTITLREEAHWSDGQPITADDVVYTFNEIYGAKNGPLNATITEKIASIVKTGDYEIQITPNPGFEFSKTIFFLFIGRWQILPAHIWPDVIAYEKTYGNNKYQMTVNWLEDSFPDNLKVASGMYFPYSQAVDDSWSLYKRNDDWWGKGILSNTLPAPEYIGMKSYPSNFAQNSEFVSGELDWFGGYIQNIDKEIQDNPYISTFYGHNSPYFASLSSIVEIVPNHSVYPLSETWMREAMAYSLNLQDMIDIGASGYLQQARVGRIDDRSPLQANLYNPAVEQQYGFNFDLTKAESILNDHAIKVDGKWYTKDAPADVVADSKYTDALPDQTGFNVLIGDWNIETVIGWSDFELHAQTFKLQMESLNIGINVDKVEYADFVGKSQTMNFDLLLYGLGPGPINSALSNFNYFVGPAGLGVNTTGWHSPKFANLVTQFETAVPGSTNEKDLAYQMQEELGKELPSIPLFGNGYWYSFNTKYWVNWPTQENNFMPGVSMWAFETTGLMQQLVWSLKANDGSYVPTTTTAGFNLQISLITSVVTITVLKKRKSSSIE